LVTAVNCCVGVITKTRLTEAGVTVTVLTGASVTVIDDVPVFVSLVAVIVTGPPAATAVTKPVLLTVATAVLLELHVTARPVSTLPLTSVSVAVSCCVGVIPKTRLAEDGLTVTALTGASVTVIEDVPVLVSLVAVIVTGPPAATPVTRPIASTVATALLLEDHVTVRPVSTLPFESFS
jgi:ABC-type amino acid transport system permease subunit